MERFVTKLQSTCIVLMESAFLLHTVRAQLCDIGIQLSVEEAEKAGKKMSREGRGGKKNWCSPDANRAPTSGHRADGAQGRASCPGGLSCGKCAYGCMRLLSRVRPAFLYTSNTNAPKNLVFLLDHRSMYVLINCLHTV